MCAYNCRVKLHFHAATPTFLACTPFPICRYVEFEKEMKALSQRHEEEASDWKQFQSDLQTAVVIANAIKAEAVEDKEILEDKNKEMARKVEKTTHSPYPLWLHRFTLPDVY